MRRLTSLAALSVAAILVLAAAVGRGETKPDDSKSNDKQAESTIVGTWRARSVSILLDDGSRRAIPSSTRSDGKRIPLNVIVSENKFTLRVGDKVLAEMTYVSDAKSDPCTIDLKSSDGPLLGIYKLSDNRLRIRLDDASRGRPKDFQGKSRGFDLSLVREVVEK